MRGVGAGRGQGEDCGLCGVQVWSWGSGPLLLRGQLPNSGWQDHFRGISKNKLFFFFLEFLAPPGLLGSGTSMLAFVSVGAARREQAGP